MRFVCDSCRAQYMISDDKVGAKGVKVRCKKCGHVITVRPAGAAAPPVLEETPTVQSPVAPPPEAERTPPGGMPVSTGTRPSGDGKEVACCAPAKQEAERACCA